MVDFAVTFEDLLVWQKSRELSKAIYILSTHWRDFELKDQIRRAVVSISSNLGYLAKSDFEALNDRADHIIKLLSKFIKSLKN